MKTNLRSLLLAASRCCWRCCLRPAGQRRPILAQAPAAQGKAAPAPAPSPEKREPSPRCSRPTPSRGSPRGRARAGSPTRRPLQLCRCRAQGIDVPPTSSTSPTRWMRATRGAPSRSSSMAGPARLPPSCTWAPWGRAPSTSRPTAPPRCSPSRSPTTPTPGSTSPTWCSSIPSATGYSRSAAGTEEADRAFFGVDKDADAMADFVRLYLTRTGPHAVAGVPGGRELRRLPRGAARRPAARRRHWRAQAWC